jgi:diacylglycerol kinase family enzyme
MIYSNEKYFYHIDGDAKGITKKVEVAILPQALSVIAK